MKTKILSYGNDGWTVREVSEWEYYNQLLHAIADSVKMRLEMCELLHKIIK